MSKICAIGICCVLVGLVKAGDDGDFVFKRLERTLATSSGMPFTDALRALEGSPRGRQIIFDVMEARKDGLKQALLSALATATMNPPEIKGTKKPRPVPDYLPKLTAYLIDQMDKEKVNLKKAENAGRVDFYLEFLTGIGLPHAKPAIPALKILEDADDVTLALKARRAIKAIEKK